MLEMLKSPVYLYKRIQEGEEGFEPGIEKFKEPEKFMLHFKPMSGESLILTGGEMSKKKVVAKLSSTYKDTFHEQDRLLLNGEPKDVFDDLNPFADFRIISVSTHYRVTEVIAEQIVYSEALDPGIPMPIR